jgi:glycosyltransferase involved in cell wall biosynthesis
MPLLSIITVIFNDKRGLEKTLANLQSQPFTDCEHIVIDGGSTDGSLEVIEKYKSRIHKFKSEPDKGIYDAMNKGLDMAIGEFVFFLNAGDEFYRQFDLSLLRQNRDKVIVGFSIQYYKTDFYLRPSRNRRELLLRYPAHQAIFVPRRLYSKTRFNIRFKVAGDYYWIQNILKGEQPLVTDKIVSLFPLGGKSSSSRLKDILHLHKEMKDPYYVLTSIVKKLSTLILGKRRYYQLLFKSKYTFLQKDQVNELNQSF